MTTEAHSHAEHATGGAGHAAGAAAHGAGPHRNYVKIWAILVVLLVISVVGPFLGIRVVTLLTAFGIAVVKAYMVAKNFMHLDVEKPIIHWMMAIAVVFMALLFAGVSPDVMKEDGLHWKKDASFHSEAHHGSGAHGAGGHGVAPSGHGAAPDTAHGGGSDSTPGAGGGSESDTSGTHDDHGSNGADS